MPQDLDTAEDRDTEDLAHMWAESIVRICERAQQQFPRFPARLLELLHERLAPRCR